jgi:hypothetical protein
MKFATTILLTALFAPTSVLAMPITYDLRDAAIEALDGGTSFSLTQMGLTATFSSIFSGNLTAIDGGVEASDLLLNRTSSAFGVNVGGTTCGGLEDSARLDDGCGFLEGVAVMFSQSVIINGVKVSSFGADLGSFLLNIGSTSLPQFDITSTGATPINKALVGGASAGMFFIQGNGFSFDSITVTKVSAPTTLALFALGLLALRRRA